MLRVLDSIVLTGEGFGVMLPHGILCCVRFNDITSEFAFNNTVMKHYFPIYFKWMDLF